MMNMSYFLAYWNRILNRYFGFVWLELIIEFNGDTLTDCANICATTLNMVFINLCQQVKYWSLTL